MHHHGSRYCSCLILIPIQLEADILSKAIANVSMATSDVLSNDVFEASSDPDPPLIFNTDTNTNMLDILLNSITGESTISDRDPDQESAATISRRQCESEMYHFFLGTNFMMKMQDINTKLYNCPLSWWKSSAHRFKNFGMLAVKYLAIPATSAPSERIWSQAARVLTVKQNRMLEKVTSTIMYCQENRELLHKYYAEIAKERMHLDDYHLIEHHKALLPKFENDKDDESKIDVGADVDREE